MSRYTFQADYGMQAWDTGERKHGFGWSLFTYVPGDVRKHDSKAEAQSFKDLNEGNQNYRNNSGHRTIVTLKQLQGMGWSRSMIVWSVRDMKYRDEGEQS